MMKRIIIVCEGPTEQAFIKRNLYSPFLSNQKYLQTPLIKASKGGIVKWATLKKQIETHLKSETNSFVTTFIDYYGIYSKYEFPGWNEAQNISDKSQRMMFLEERMLQDIDNINRHRFIPYLQLHEFEGLLFNELSIFESIIPASDLIGLTELKKTLLEYPNPELINDSRETSPSHRLIRIINGYNKVVYGDILSEAIGISRIREKSPRFNEWIKKLESI